jgi:ABC-type uncharacterized transport system substrate-binding protein
VGGEKFRRETPGGNVTGLSSRQPDTASKRLELLRELVPGLHLLGILTDVGNPFAGAGIGEVRGAARTLGLEVSTYEIRLAGDIDRAFEALKGREQALYVLTVPLLFANCVRINTLALGARLPTMHGVRESVEAGGLMSLDLDPASIDVAQDHVGCHGSGCSPVWARLDHRRLRTRWEWSSWPPSPPRPPGCR